jgi:hypothetical protein
MINFRPKRFTASTRVISESDQIATPSANLRFKSSILREFRSVEEDRSSVNSLSGFESGSDLCGQSLRACALTAKGQASKPCFIEELRH